MIGKSTIPPGLGIIVLALTVSGCATFTAPDSREGGRSSIESTQPRISSGENARTSPSSLELLSPTRIDRTNLNEDQERTRIFPGTGSFIDRRAAQKPVSVEQTTGDVTLNFESAGVREVVKVIFDILQENYVIDPAVQGEITVQTSRPLTKEMLIPTLEMLLRMNQAALIRAEGIYKVVPLTQALPGNLSPRLMSAAQRPGYQVRIVPLQYVGAAEMQKILEPFLPQGALLRVDPTRNLLMLAGTGRELATIQETIDIFDVNWLQGMSIGMYKLQNIDSQVVVAELDNLFGKESELPLAGMFRFVPINQFNAILVITPQPEYLKQASQWIERLDGVGGERLHVYEMQNSGAEYVASLLNQVFGVGEARPTAPAPEVAPGRQPAILTSPLADQQPEAEAPPVEAQPERPSATAASAVDLGIGGESVRIIADIENNALLIWADNQNYEKVISALRRLDVARRQVLIEATIAEVTLSGALQYGLQWFFKNNDVLNGLRGTGSLDLNVNEQLVNKLGSGFSYALSDGAGIVRALLDTLASESKLRVLSSPQLMVIDNQEAEIRVGTQQPVFTSTSITEGGVQIQSIEFRDTGVLLTVRPQINAGGLVTMALSQEVTDVGPDDLQTGNPTFFQRTINSQVAIQNGETIVLGGLIRDREVRSRSGVPGLYKLPVVGPLFGSTDNNTERTELVVLITPQVIQDGRDAARVAQELKQKMRSVAPFMDQLIRPTRLSE